MEQTETEPQRRDGRFRDTRQRIEAVALELFTTKGVGQTTLQEIADRLGLTKTALYYHFNSKGELVRSVVRKSVEELTAFLNEVEHDPDDPRAILEGFFDLCYTHRNVLRALIFDPTAMAHLDHTDFMPRPTHEAQRLLAGPDPTPEQRIRAFMAIQGLSRCATLLDDVDHGTLRTTAITVAYETLTGAPEPAPPG